MADSRLMDFRCSVCQVVHHIPRALAVTCPRCRAAPGRRCLDLRARSGEKYRLTPHAEREALIP
jgi:hypothetical protein